MCKIRSLSTEDKDMNLEHKLVRKNYEENKKYIDEYIKNNNTTKGVLAHLPHRDAFEKNKLSVKNIIPIISKFNYNIFYR